MSNFKEELDWYWSKRMYVYPFKSSIERLKWSDWKNIKDMEYKEKLSDYYKEDALGLNLVTGKKGICGIGIRRDTNNRHSLAILQEVLELLELSKDYLWVLETPHEYIILVDIAIGFNNKDPKHFKNIRIIWEEGLQVPVKERGSYPIQFAKSFYPQDHPTQINKEIIYNCIKEIDERAIINSKSPWWKKLFIHMGKVLILLCLIALVGAIPVAGIPAIIVFFWINWDKIFKKKERERKP